MGKTTLYHPISLHVIRGAAEYCGWKFGKLDQITNDQETTTAVYAGQITQVPPEMSEKGYRQLRECLQNCFMDDISIDNVWRTRSGQWMCLIAVDLRLGSPDHQDGSNRLRQTGSKQ